MTLYQTALSVYVVAIPIALFLGLRTADRALRSLLFLVMVVAGLVVGFLWFAEGICCY